MKRFFKTMAFTLLGLVLSINLNAEMTKGSASITFSEQSIENATVVDGTEFELGSFFKVVFAKGTNGGTAPTYYTSGNPANSIRCYCNKNKSDGNSLTISRTTDGATAAAVITKVTFTGGQKQGTVAWDLTGSKSGTEATYNISDAITEFVASMKETGNSKNGQYNVPSVAIEYYYEASTPIATLTSIAITGTATHLNYTEGETFDKAGLTITGTYSDASQKEITTGVTWSYNPETLALTTTSVIVTASVEGVENAQTKVENITVSKAPVEITSIDNIIDGCEYYIKGVRTNTAYYLTFTDAVGATQAGTESATMDGAVKLKFIANGENVYNIQTPEGYYIAPGTSNGKINVSTDPIDVTASNQNNEIRLSIVSGSDTWSIQKNTGGANFGGYKNTQSDITLMQVGDCTPTPSISADAEEIAFDQKELSVTATDSKVISATGKNLTAAISASMKSGSAAVFSVVANGTPTAAAGEFTVSYSTTEAGEYAGTVVLSSGETSLEIPVSASVVAHIPVLQSIYVKGEPTKKEYTVGDAFETDGLEVWGKYDEGADQQITENIEWEVTPATFSATTETSVSVVATALEKTSEAFVVTGLTINAAPQIATYDFTTNLYGHTGVSSGSDNHDGDIAVNEIFTEAPTQIKFIKAGSTVTRFWSNKGTSELRIYKDAEFTISSTDYNITKVEFAGTVNLKVDETTVSDQTWTGKQKSVTFVNTNSNSALTGITVTYAEAAPSAATPTITPSADADIYFDNITVTLATTTEGAEIHYTTDGTDPTEASALYENPIAVSATTTVKAIAVKEGLDNSEVASKTFTFGPVFASLEDLAAAELTKGTTVKVSFSNVEIKSIFTSGGGKRQGIFFDIQKGGKDIEIYYASVEVPETWVAKGTVSGTMTCPWTEYNGTWELAPAANSWNWSNLTYTAPAVTGLTKVEVDGAPSKTTYVDGEKFNPAGLTIYATIDDVRDVYDGSKGEVIYTIDPETLTEGTTSVSVVATIGTVSSEAYEVTGLTVNAIQESTIADFISNEGGRCYLIGTVSGKSGNNFTLTDASGSIYVYGHTLATGVEAVADDDYIKVIAEEYEYFKSTTHEAKNVIVVEKPSVAVTGVSLDKEEADVQQGQSLTLIATITPAGASNKNLSWSIINDNANGKISVDQDGKVTVAEDATPEETATVQVETEDGHYTATCVITVKEYKAVKYGKYYGALTEGDYVITSGTKALANTKVSDKNRINSADFTEDNAYVIDPLAAIVWHIEKSGDVWTIYNVATEKYAGSTNTKNEGVVLDAATTDNAKWSVTSDENSVTYDFANVARAAAENDPNNKWLRYNDQVTAWACYTNSTGGALTLYKKDFKAKAVLTSIAISGDLTKKDYFVDQKILPAGLTVTGTYSDNSQEIITEGITWGIDPESFSAETESGSVQITATVEGITSPAITINDIVVTEKPNVHTYGYFDFTTDGPDIDFSTGWSNSYAEHIVTAEEATVTFASASKQGGTITNMPVSKGDDVVLHLTKEDKQIASVCLTTEQWNSNTHTITIEVSYDGTNYTELTGVSGDETNGVQANISDIAITYVKFKFTGTKQIGIESLTFTTADIPYVTMREGQILENGKMYSFCSPYDLICVKGAIFYQPDYMDAAYVHFVEAKEIKAGYGYIIEGKGEALKAVQVGEAVTSAVTADAENTRGMQGVLEGDRSEGKAGFQFTETSYNHVVVVNNHLQYVGALNIVPVGRAYLDLGIIVTLNKIEEDERPGLRRVSINFGGQAPTDINGLNGNMKAAKVLRDGQLYIIRDTKTYNAQGIEVQ